MFKFELIKLINSKILNSELRINLFLVLLMIFIASILEVISIGAFLPLVEIVLGGKSGLLENEIVNNNIFLSEFLKKISEDRIIILGLVSFGFIIVFKNILVFCFHYYREFINCKLQTSLVNNLFKKIMNKDYDNFYEKNSSIYYNLLVREAGRTSHTINVFLHLFNEITVLFFVIAFLLILQPVFTSTLVIIFFLVSLPIYILTKEKIKSMSSKRIIRDQNVLKNITEAFSLFKYLKVHFLENSFLKSFNSNNFESNNLQKNMSILQTLPRYYFEAITVIVFSGILIYIRPNGDSFEDMLPLIAVFSFAGLRLLPLIKSVVMGLQEVKRGTPVVKSVCEELTSDSLTHEIIEHKNFKKVLIKDLNFQYSDKVRILNKFNFEINSGDKILVQGQSGAGKTTFIDILIGVKKQNSGSIFLDEKEINSSLYKNTPISYIPQSSYLIDDTIQNNIIFPVEKYDEKYLKEIIRIVGLNNIIHSLPEKENTFLGENGYKISGGQKQRIIIARSLILNPKILVLDEATNALDIKSEATIIKNIVSYFKDMTIFIISHRNLDEGLFNKTIKIGEN